MSAPVTPDPQALVKTARDRAGIILGILAVAIALVALFFGLQRAESRADGEAAAKEEAQAEASSERAEKLSLAEEVEQACAAGGAAARQLGEACPIAVEYVEGPTGPAGPPPSDATVTRIVQNVIASRPGLVEGAVEDVVVDYLVRNPPADGETPSRAEVREVVETVYAASPPAPGRDGTDGTNGTDGADGQDGAPGQDGETPTLRINDDGQLIATYPISGRTVDLGNVIGPEGPVGPKGEQGEPGPTCPEGYTGQVVTVETGDSPINSDTRQLFACVPAGG